MYSLGLVSSRSAASRIALVSDRGARTCREFGDVRRSVLDLMMVPTQHKNATLCYEAH
jgi:hypothetical protein